CASWRAVSDTLTLSVVEGADGPAFPAAGWTAPGAPTLGVRRPFLSSTFIVLACPFRGGPPLLYRQVRDRALGRPRRCCGPCPGGPARPWRRRRSGRTPLRTRRGPVNGAAGRSRGWACAWRAAAA